MLVIKESVGILFAEVKVDATNRHVHRGQLPCGRIGFLTVHRDMLFLLGSIVLLLLRVLLDELAAGDKKAAAAHRWVIHAAGIGFEHFYDQRHDAFGRVVLTALLAFG